MILFHELYWKRLGLLIFYSIYILKHYMINVDVNFIGIRYLGKKKMNIIGFYGPITELLLYEHNQQ